MHVLPMELSFFPSNERVTWNNISIVDPINDSCFILLNCNKKVKEKF